MSVAHEKTSPSRESSVYGVMDVEKEAIPPAMDTKETSEDVRGNSRTF
jgi:hypothetical protein